MCVNESHIAEGCDFLFFFAMGGGPAAAVCAVVALVLLLTWHFGETPAKQRVYNSSEIARLARRSRSHSHYYVITSPKDHRSFVGGMWSEIGELELAFMRRMGLEQKHTLIDVGCGALRGGVHFVRYLDAEKYYGVDLNPHLLTIGLEKEVAPLGLSSKLPRSHLHATPDFGVDHFGVVFDYAISVSVWTHLPLDEVSKSMHKVAAVLEPTHGRFYATFYECPEGAPLHKPILQYHHQLEKIVSHGHKDWFHHKRSALESRAQAAGLSMRFIGDWGHPRGQLMLEFRRLSSAPPPAKKEAVE